MKKTILLSSLIAGFLFSGCGTKLSQQTIVNEGSKEGIVNTKGEITVKPVYERVRALNGEDKKYYHPNYANFHLVHDNRINYSSYAIVKDINNKFGIIDDRGNLKLKVEYDHIGDFFNGFAKVSLNGKYGFINEKFETVLEPVFDEVQEFVNNTAVVKQGNKYGCIDKNMNLKIEPIFDMIYLEEEGFRRVELDNRWGFADQNCYVAVKPVYDYAYDFRNGFAKVKEAGLWGFLGKDGKLLLKQIFDDPDRF